MIQHINNISVFRFLAMTLAIVTVSLPFSSPVQAITSQPRNWQMLAGYGGAGKKIATMKFYPGAITINEGDSITWKATGSAHTVTFLSGATPTSPEDPATLMPRGSSTYNGAGVASSGIIVPTGTEFPAPHSYTLTFTKAGTYHYQCLFHPGMKGKVIVQAKNSAYPKTQTDYTRQARKQGIADVFSGLRLLSTQSKSPPTINGNGTKTFQLKAGLGNGVASVMRFLPQTMFIHVNDSIRWTNQDPMEPHTVTFPGPDKKVPSETDPAAFAPIGGATFDGTQLTSSGLILPSEAKGHHSYTLKFTKAGQFEYECLLHDDMGMRGKVIVLP